MKSYYAKSLCNEIQSYNFKKYDVEIKDTIEQIQPGQIIIFNKPFEEIIEQIQIVSYIYVQEAYLIFSDQNLCPTFHVGLNFFPLLQDYKIILTGFISQTLLKKNYKSLSLGLNAKIINVKTVDEIKLLFFDNFTKQKFNTIIFVYQPYLLIKLLQKLDQDQQAKLLQCVRSVKLLDKLSQKNDLSRVQIQNLVEDPQYYLFGLDNLKIATFKQPATQTRCLFQKVNLIKDMYDQSLENLLSNRAFMLLVDPSYKKYYELTQKYMQKTQIISISKIYGCNNLSTGKYKQFYCLTNLQLVENQINLLSLQLIYSKPIIIVKLYNDEQISHTENFNQLSLDHGPENFFDFCTILPQQVLDDKLDLLSIYQEKIFVVGSKHKIQPFYAKISKILQIRSIFWLQTAILVHEGVQVRKSVDSQQMTYKIPKLIGSKIIIQTPDILFDLGNQTLFQLSEDNFVSCQQEIDGLSLKSVIELILTRFSEVQSQQLQGVLKEQLNCKGGDQIKGSVLIDLLHKNVPLQQAISKSTQFEQQFDDFLVQQPSIGIQHSRISDASIVAEELLLNLDDPIFTMD